LFGGIIPGDDGARWFSCAQVDCLMGNSRWYEEKVSSFTNHFVLKVRAPSSADPTLQHIDSSFVADVDVWLGAATRWNDNQVHRQASGVHGLAGYAYEVRQTLPTHDLAAWAEANDFKCLVFHGGGFNGRLLFDA
jgi:hypothetical protein